MEGGTSVEQEKSEATENTERDLLCKSVQSCFLSPLYYV